MLLELPISWRLWRWLNHREHQERKRSCEPAKPTNNESTISSIDGMPWLDLSGTACSSFAEEVGQDGCAEELDLASAAAVALERMMRAELGKSAATSLLASGGAGTALNGCRSPKEMHNGCSSGDRRHYHEDQRPGMSKAEAEEIGKVISCNRAPCSPSRLPPVPGSKLMDAEKGASASSCRKNPWGTAGEQRALHALPLCSPLDFPRPLPLLSLGHPTMLPNHAAFEGL